MKTVRKRKVCKLNGMKYDPELRCVIAKHRDGGDNHFHLPNTKVILKEMKNLKRL